MLNKKFIWDIKGLAWLLINVVLIIFLIISNNTIHTFINKIPLSLQTHNNLFQNSFPKHLCSRNRKIISQRVCLSRHHLHFQHLNHSSPALNIVCVVVVVYFFVAAHLSTLRWRLIGNFAFGPKLLPSLRLRCWFDRRANALTHIHTHTHKRMHVSSLICVHFSSVTIQASEPPDRQPSCPEVTHLNSKCVCVRKHATTATSLLHLNLNLSLFIS